MLTTGGQGLDLQELRTRLSGSVVAPEDASWNEARQAWNLAVDQRPALVALPENVDDVVAIVDFARANGLRVAAQGTGHNAAAFASLDRTVLVKTSQMKGVAIDGAGRRARVAAGTLWAEVTGPASEHGLAPLAGSSPDVGVVGYTLGGGLSWLSRRHGLAANSVIAIEIVTADGRIVRCDRDNEPGLFWALRGGGGSFGVVTAIEFVLYPAPQVYAGAMLWPWERATEVLNRYVEWSRTAPDTISTSVRLLQVPPMPDIPEALQGRNFVAIDGAYLGDEAAAAEVLAPLRALGPEFDMFAPMPAAGLSHIHMDPEHPVPVMGDGMVLDRLTPAAIDALVEAVGPGSGSPLLMVELRHLGGAIGVPPAEHGALAKLGGEFALFAGGIPMDAEVATAIAAYLSALTAALDPWDAGRRYMNFTERPSDAREFFSEGTLVRLQAVKTAYDPAGVFLANHPVPTAA
jgi:FAD binding domain/Berberine and berberine like